MAGGRNIDVGVAWEAAVDVVASAYRIDPSVLGAGSRGRGPRPPANVWEARKLCIFVAVATANCDYAELGRHVGLHRDTVTSHCAGMREQCAADPAFEIRAEGLIEAALHRVARPIAPPPMPAAGEIDGAAIWLAVDARLAGIERMLREILARPTMSDDAGLHPTALKTHENVIKIARGGRR